MAVCSDDGVDVEAVLLRSKVSNLRSHLVEIASQNPHDSADRCLDAFLEIFPEYE